MNSEGFFLVFSVGDLRKREAEGHEEVTFERDILLFREMFSEQHLLTDFWGGLCWTVNMKPIYFGFKQTGCFFCMHLCS